MGFKVPGKACNPLAKCCQLAHDVPLLTELPWLHGAAKTKTAVQDVAMVISASGFIQLTVQLSSYKLLAQEVNVFINYFIILILFLNLFIYFFKLILEFIFSQCF